MDVGRFSRKKGAQRKSPRERRDDIIRLELDDGSALCLRKATRSVGDRSTDVTSSPVQYALKVCPGLALKHTTILPSSVAVGTKDWRRISECVKAFQGSAERRALY